MRRFVHRENIKHLRGVLERTTDAAERRRIQQLIAEQETQLPDPEPEPEPEQRLCPFCQHTMIFRRSQEMEIKGRGRVPLAIFFCARCNRVHLDLGDGSADRKQGAAE